MSRIRIAVVGAGHLGKIHARILKTLADFELTAIVDPSEGARQAAAEQFGVSVTADHRDYLDKVDAVVVAAPTTYHHHVTRDFLEAGVHALVEKPLTASVFEAEELVECALLRRLALQVGHVERFNPAFRAVQPLMAAPRYIECLREGPFSFRSTDIGAVLDLMIHDIDLALALAQSPVVDVEACGMSLLGKREDVVHVRLKFADGCTAVLNASRVGHVPARQMKIRTANRFASVDFNARTAMVTHIDERLTRGTVDIERLDSEEKQSLKAVLLTDLLRQEKLEFEPYDAVTAELQDFALAIQTGRRPTVSGLDGLASIRVAARILECLEGTKEQPAREQRPATIPGPHWHRRSAVGDNLREAG